MNSRDTNASKFLAAFNELEAYMRHALNLDDHVPHTKLVSEMAKKNKIFLKKKEDLISFNDLRNAIVHNPKKKEFDPIAEPHDNIVKFYVELLNEVTKPPVALKTIAVCAKDIYTISMDDIALNVIKDMNKYTYTHVPVIEEGNLIGVFSENTIFSYIASNEDVLVEKDAPVREFSNFIPLDKHEREYFEFISKDALIIDIEEKFQKGLKDKKRLATIFITETGSKKEKLLGLVTAWDLAGYDNN